MSFYVTLFSNKTLDLNKTYNNNLLNSNYRWEVAISKLYLSLDLIQLPKNTGLFSIMSTYNHFVPTLEQDYKLDVNLEFMHISQLLTVLQSLLKIKDIFSVDYNPSINRFFITDLKAGPSKYNYIKFEEPLASLLGFKSKLLIPHKIQRDSQAPYPPDIYAGVRNIYIYTNFTDSQYLGSIKVPILSIIPLNLTSKINIYEPRHRNYVAIKSQALYNINLLCRANTGEMIAFRDYMYLNIELHFRKINE